MNLIGDPWIPVIYESGTLRMVGLRELFEKAHEIRDLVLNPPQRVSVMRLLICITQTALNGPEDEKGWVSCREQIAPESVSYLDKSREKFELFGEQPFLQVSDLEPIDNATLDKLDFGLASGNNPTLFDHGASKNGRMHAPRRIALILLTYQCFSPGGRIGVTKWAGKNTGSGASEHAPCVEGSAMHTLLRGKNVLETIHLNLLTKKQVQKLPGSLWGQPVWDDFPSSQKGVQIKELTHSYLGRLVPLSRAALINQNSTFITLVNGLPYSKLPASREPMATVVIKGREGNQRLGYLRIALSQHPWRELGSLLNLKYMKHSGGALALEHLKNLPSSTFDLWVGGLVADKGKLIDVAEWNLTLPSTLLDSAVITKYQKGVEVALQGATALGKAVQIYCEYFAEKAGRRSKASVSYWTGLDSNHEKLINTASDATASLEVWRKGIVTKIMNSAYESACPHETPKQIQAFAQGRSRLYIPALSS